jgi:hypothetical protein
MRSYLICSLLVLGSLPSHAAEHKWAWQPQESYTPFPPETEPILQEKAERLGPISPLVKVFSSIPEKMSVWPSMEATAVRNSYQSNLFKIEAYFA